MHPLDGPRLKVVRAREHLYVLQDHEARFFLDGKAYDIADDFDAQASKHVFRVKVLKNPPTRRFAALIGDCVHNLRSALDHLAWQLSNDFGGPNDADARTQFPIFRFERGKRGFDVAGAQQISRIGPGAATVIRLLQPFHDDQPLVHPLWFVHDLDRRDKHRQLSVSAAAVSGYAHRIYHAKKAGGIFNLTLSLEDIKDGMVVAELAIKPPKSYIAVEPHFVFRAALTAPTVPITKPRLIVCPFLGFLMRCVEGVINCFEPFYASGTYDDTVVLGSDPIRPFHEPAPYDPSEAAMTLTEEEHTDWAKQAHDDLNLIADEALSKIRSSADMLSLDGDSLRSLLMNAEATGFLLGVDKTLERVEKQREGDLELPSAGTLQ
jgi:hypothetical protein